MLSILITDLNPEFVIWFIQYLSPAGIIFMFTFYYSYKGLLVIYDIIRELKKRQKKDYYDD